MRLSLCGIMTAALLVAAPLGLAHASAEIVETSPGHLACSTSAGQYEHIDIGRYVSGNKLTGRFRFVAGTDDRSRAPVAGYIIRFHNGEAIEVHVMADPRYPRRLDIQVGLSGAGSQTVTRVPRSEPVEVTATVASGVLTVASAGRSREIPIGARQVVGVDASCQSGSFEIEFQPPVSG
jgi:hypothetical protein